MRYVTKPGCNDKLSEIFQIEISCPKYKAVLNIIFTTIHMHCCATMTSLHKIKDIYQHMQTMKTSLKTRRDENQYGRI